MVPEHRPLLPPSDRYPGGRPSLQRRLPWPRLLPLTIIGISCLLALKLVDATIAVLPDGSRRPMEAARAQIFSDVAYAATPPATAPAPAGQTAAGPAETPQAQPAESKAADTKATDTKLAEAMPANAKDATKPEGKEAASADAKSEAPQPGAAIAPGATSGSAATPIGEVAAQLGPGASESERALLVDLRARRKALDQRDAALTERAHLMDAAEARLNARLDELKVLQAKLEAMEKARQAQSDANMRGLVKVYEDMKPRDAATIWNDLDLNVLLPLLDLMKDSKASAILAAMDPVRAREATAQLSRRRAQATMLSTSPATSPPGANPAGNVPPGNVPPGNGGLGSGGTSGASNTGGAHRAAALGG